MKLTSTAKSGSVAASVASLVALQGAAPLLRPLWTMVHVAAVALQERPDVLVDDLPGVLEALARDREQRLDVVQVQIEAAGDVAVTIANALGLQLTDDQVDLAESRETGRPTIRLRPRTLPWHSTPTIASAKRWKN